MQSTRINFTQSLASSCLHKVFSVPFCVSRFQWQAFKTANEQKVGLSYTRTMRHPSLDKNGRLKKLFTPKFYFVELKTAQIFFHLRYLDCRNGITAHTNARCIKDQQNPFLLQLIANCYEMIEPFSAEPKGKGAKKHSFRCH